MKVASKFNLKIHLEDLYLLEKDSTYPDHLVFTKIEQRVFAYIFVRCGSSSLALKLTYEFLEDERKIGCIRVSGHDLKKRKGTSDLIEYERRLIIQELRLKTISVCDRAIDTLVDVMESKSAIARVQAASVLLEMGGVRKESTEKISDTDPFVEIDEKKREEIMRAMREQVLKSVTSLHND